MSDWFDQLPSEWGVTRLKNVVECTQTGVWGDDPRSDDDDVLCVRVADFDRPRFAVGPAETVRSVPLKDREARRLQSGDLLLEKSGGTDVNPVGFTVMFTGDYEAVSSNFITRVRLRSSQSPRFWLYALAASYSTKRTERSVKRTTGIQNLDQTAFFDELFPLPPSVEQRAIADFLDRETARIDTLIAEQQRLIELLRERREAQIEHAVWGGLDEVPRKRIPIEPAPEVPAHWKILRNKNLVCESAAVSADGGEELLSVSHLTGITPRSEKNVTMTEAESLEGYRQVNRGDLVINTMWAWMGALGVSRVEGIVSPAYGVYRPLKDAHFHPPYFDYLFRSRLYVLEMTRFSRGIWSSRLRIYPEVFLRLNVVVPPLEEQQKIADYLDEQTAKIDTLIAETEKFIELSRERRAALITAAVTGQIDVREVA